MFTRSKGYQSWPTALYLDDAEQTVASFDRSYQDWESGESEDGYIPYTRDPTRQGVYHSGLSGLQFLNITTPFMVKPRRRPDPYQVSKARLEKKPRLEVIPERGADGAGRHISSLSGSELAEIASMMDSATKLPTNGISSPHASWNRDNNIEQPNVNQTARSTYMLHAQILATNHDQHLAVSGHPRGSRDKDSMAKEKKKKRMQLYIAIITTAVILGTAISVGAIYFSLQRIKNNPADEATVQYGYSIRLRGISMTSSLEDESTIGFTTMQADICDTFSAMDRVPVVTYCKLTDVRIGSVIADVTLTFMASREDDYDQANPSGSFPDFVLQTISSGLKMNPQPIKRVAMFIDKYDPDTNSLFRLRLGVTTASTNPVTATTTSPYSALSTTTSHDHDVTTMVVTTTESSTSEMTSLLLQSTDTSSLTDEGVTTTPVSIITTKSHGLTTQERSTTTQAYALSTHEQTTTIKEESTTIKEAVDTDAETLSTDQQRITTTDSLDTHEPVVTTYGKLHATTVDNITEKHKSSIRTDAQTSSDEISALSTDVEQLTTQINTLN